MCLSSYLLNTYILAGRAEAMSSFRMNSFMEWILKTKEIVAFIFFLECQHYSLCKRSELSAFVFKNFWESWTERVWINLGFFHDFEFILIGCKFIYYVLHFWWKLHWFLRVSLNTLYAPLSMAFRISNSFSYLLI